MPDHNSINPNAFAIALVAADDAGRHRLAALYDRHAPKANWLSENRALDIQPVARTALKATLAEIDSALGATAIDRFVLPVAGRRKALLASDMDSTMIAIECIDELADLVGRKAEIAAITERAMQGELDFDAALIRRVRCLQGVDIGQVERVCRERVVFCKGAATLIATMRRHGAETVLVSGGFRMFTAYVARRLGFDLHFANGLGTIDGTLTGEVEEPLFGPGDKRSVLIERAAELQIDLAQTLAIGDGANDLPMLTTAGAGFAYKAKPALRACTNLRIDHTDLTSVLYAQGYRDDEIDFVEDNDVG